MSHVQAVEQTNPQGRNFHSQTLSQKKIPSFAVDQYLASIHIGTNDILSQRYN